MNINQCKLCGNKMLSVEELSIGFHLECDGATRLITQEDAEALANWLCGNEGPGQISGA